MRTYYVFNINKEMSILSKESPYMLYKSFESIYKARKNDLHMATNLYEQLTMKFNKEILNEKIISSFENNNYYLCNHFKHRYYNKYKDELCEIDVKNSYLIIRSNMMFSKLIKNVFNYNLFVCDFENRDYFWYDEIYS